MDRPLAKAEPVSDTGSTSVTTYLQEGESRCIAARRKKVKKCERHNPADTKVRKEGGGEGSPGAREEILLQPVMKTVVMQVVPLQPMEEHGGVDIHPAACGGHHTRPGDVP